MTDALKLPETGTNVPLTVLGSLNYPDAAVGIGGNYIQPTGPAAQAYWYLVVDLSSLDVLVNEVSNDYNSVPADVQKYIGLPATMLVFVTVQLTMDRLPQGTLFSALKEAGAGRQLDRIEQFNEQMGTGTLASVAYILVTTLADDDLPGFEESSTSTIPFLTLQLLPVTVDGKTTYTPITLD